MKVLHGMSDVSGQGSCTVQGLCRAGVEAIKAGCDMIMKPGNFRGSVNAVIDAVESGEIPEARINESVNRILRTKDRL